METMRIVFKEHVAVFLFFQNRLSFQHGGGWNFDLSNSFDKREEGPREYAKMYGINLIYKDIQRHGPAFGFKIWTGGKTQFGIGYSVQEFHSFTKIKSSNVYLADQNQSYNYNYSLGIINILVRSFFYKNFFIGIGPGYGGEDSENNKDNDSLAPIFGIEGIAGYQLSITDIFKIEFTARLFFYNMSSSYKIWGIVPSISLSFMI